MNFTFSTSQGNPDCKDSPGCPKVGISGWRPWPVSAVSTRRRPQTEACWLGSCSGARGFRPAHPTLAGALRGSMPGDACHPRECGLGFRRATCLEPRRPTVARRLFIRTLYCAVPDGRPSSTSFATAVAAASALVVPFCSGPKGPSFTGGHCEFGFCRGTVICDSRRPGFNSRHSGCCGFGAGHATCSGPRRPISTRRLREFGCCRDPVASDSERPSFASRLCDCCGGVIGRVLLSGQGRASFTRRHRSFGFCRSTVL